MSRRSPCCGWRAKRGRKAARRPCVFNAANEVAVAAFLDGRLPFLGIAEVVADALDAQRRRARTRPRRSPRGRPQRARARRREAGRRMTWLVVAVGLLLLIFLHELGHFTVALAVGNRPRGFYVGFGPKLASFKRNGIEYGLRLIPAGGYVRLPGMHRPAARDIEAFMGPGAARGPESRPIGPAHPPRARDRRLRRGARAAIPSCEPQVASARADPGGAPLGEPRAARHRGGHERRRVLAPADRGSASPSSRPVRR